MKTFLKNKDIKENIPAREGKNKMLKTALLKVIPIVIVGAVVVLFCCICFDKPEKNYIPSEKLQTALEDEGNILLFPRVFFEENFDFYNYENEKVNDDLKSVIFSFCETNNEYGGTFHIELISGEYAENYDFFNNNIYINVKQDDMITIKGINIFILSDGSDSVITYYDKSNRCTYMISLYGCPFDKAVEIAKTIE